MKERAEKGTPTFPIFFPKLTERDRLEVSLQMNRLGERRGWPDSACAEYAQTGNGIRKEIRKHREGG